MFEVQCSNQPITKSFWKNIIFFTWNGLGRGHCQPFPTIGDYKRENIVFFLPVLEQEMIRNICFKIFETYILSWQFRNIYLFKKVNIFLREYAIYETMIMPSQIVPLIIKLVNQSITSLSTLCIQKVKAKHPEIFRKTA